MTYSEKLKDPRWQKTRLKVLERDNFTCVCCGDSTKQLHVHHCYYVSKREPWDYNHHALLTLCIDCHKSADEPASPANMICTKFEWAALFEMQRQCLNRFNQVDGDDGAFFEFARASLDNGWPVYEAMNVIRDASALGIIDGDWILKLSRQVREKSELIGVVQ